MALRVLLADESSTIKKVMQLALQDFGVEVKSVPIGLDVLQVCRSFQPDIVFADVLLSKKSGYDVSAELKQDPVLRGTPVVLMWSSFMELDDARAQASGAERRLEKPFDADHLRSLVKDLVPRLNENAISNYLTFPDLPEIVEAPMPESVAAAPPPPPPPPKKKPAAAEMPPLPIARQVTPQSAPPRAAKPEPNQTFETFDLTASENLEDPDDFQQVPLPGSKTNNVLDKPARRDEEEWRQGGLEQFRVSPEALELEDANLFADVSEAPIAITGSDDEMLLEDLEDLTQPAPPSAAKTSTPRSASAPAAAAHFGGGAAMSLDPMRAEEILREQVREVLESIAWKIIPDIAERVVREEVQRLLKDAERLS